MVKALVVMNEEADRVRKKAQYLKYLLRKNLCVGHLISIVSIHLLPNEVGAV